MEETIHIIGSGPSLKDVDMKSLKNKKTISFNRSYVSFKNWGFEPTYYLVLDWRGRMKHFVDDVNDLIKNSNITKFFIADTDFSREHVIKTDKVIFFETSLEIFFLKRDGIYSYCGDAVISSIQLLYEEGFRKGILYGVDGENYNKHYSEEYSNKINIDPQPRGEEGKFYIWVKMIPMFEKAGFMLNLYNNKSRLFPLIGIVGSSSYYGYKRAFNLLR